MLTEQDEAPMSKVLAGLPSDGRPVRLLVGEEKCLKIRTLMQLHDGRQAMLVEACGAPRGTTRTVTIPLTPEQAESIRGMMIVLAQS